MKVKKIQYERIGTLPIETVLPYIEKHFNDYQKIRVHISDYYVNVSSLRLKSFFFHGTSCSCCENKASFFAVERNFGTDSPYHLNLYGIDKDGTEILFTHDHILARSLGGTDTIDNTRTSCGPCNWKKGQLEHLIKECSDEKEKELLQQKLQKFLPEKNLISLKFKSI